jgi:hypothetical protein
MGAENITLAVDVAGRAGGIDAGSFDTALVRRTRVATTATVGGITREIATFIAAQRRADRAGVLAGALDAALPPQTAPRATTAAAGVGLEVTAGAVARRLSRGTGRGSPALAGPAGAGSAQTDDPAGAAVASISPQVDACDAAQRLSTRALAHSTGALFALLAPVAAASAVARVALKRCRIDAHSAALRLPSRARVRPAVAVTADFA